MQEFATGKASALGSALNQLTCSFKSRCAVRVMKLTTIILLSACLHVSANGISQTVTLSMKNAPIEKVFKAIKQQTHYVFFSNYELLQKARKRSEERCVGNEER